MSTNVMIITGVAGVVGVSSIGYGIYKLGKRSGKKEAAKEFKTGNTNT